MICKLFLVMLRVTIVACYDLKTKYFESYVTNNLVTVDIGLLVVFL